MARHNYVNWLIEHIDAEPLLDLYEQLFLTFDQVPFPVRIADDANRASDGLMLRKEYLAEGGILRLNHIHDASVLEVLVSLVDRVDYCLGLKMTKQEWMEMFIHNMGLESCTDERYADMGDQMLHDMAIARALNTTFYRRYNTDGLNGGLFVVPQTDKDMRRLSLFEQWNEFAKYTDIPPKWE